MNEEQQKIWEILNGPSCYLIPRLVAACIRDQQFELPERPLRWEEWQLLECIHETRCCPRIDNDALSEEELDKYFSIIKRFWTDWYKADDPINKFGKIMVCREIEHIYGEKPGRI